MADALDTLIDQKIYELHLPPPYFFHFLVYFFTLNPNTKSNLMERIGKAVKKRNNSKNFNFLRIFMIFHNFFEEENNNYG